MRTLQHCARRKKWRPRPRRPRRTTDPACCCHWIASAASKEVPQDAQRVEICGLSLPVPPHWRHHGLLHAHVSCRRRRAAEAAAAGRRSPRQQRRRLGLQLRQGRGPGGRRPRAATRYSPLPLIFSHKSEKSSCGAGITLAEAESWCLQNASCAAFTFAR